MVDFVHDDSRRGFINKTGAAGIGLGYGAGSLWGSSMNRMRDIAEAHDTEVNVHAMEAYRAFEASKEHTHFDDFLRDELREPNLEKKERIIQRYMPFYNEHLKNRSDDYIDAVEDAVYEAQYQKLLPEFTAAPKPKNAAINLLSPLAGASAGYGATRVAGEVINQVKKSNPDSRRDFLRKFSFRQPKSEQSDPKNVVN